MTVIGAFIVVITNRRRTKAEEKARHLEKQKALEHEIVHAKNYLENILENTQNLILVIGIDFTVRTVNSAYEKMFGRPKDGILSKNFFEIFPFSSPKDKHLFLDMVRESMTGGVKNIRDYPVDCGTETRKINIVLSPLSLHGMISGVILSGVDVTEEAVLKERIREYAHKLEEIVRERTQELLREKEKLNAIVESIEAGICIFDSGKNLIWTNRVMKNWLSEEKIADLTLDDIYTGKYSFESITHAVVDNRFVQEVVYNDFGNKKGYFQVVSTPLLSTEGKSNILVLIQDLTDIKMAEEQMMQSEKLSALARLSAGVAHEIGNPLTSISSYVQILKEMDFDDFTKEALETISRHINRIVTIVRQMSSFTKTKQEEIEKQSLKEIIGSTVQLVKYDKRMKNIRIREEIGNNIPDVKVNGDQLEQVFINIVLNAADAMPDGGELTIRTFRNQNNIDIEFTDTGEGIESEHIEKIFDPFFTTKEKGTGLGLSVSYTIIRNFGGTILVSSIPEKGTTFTVRLPAHEG
jgi:PAS domain S-box-containing protein